MKSAITWIGGVLVAVTALSAAHGADVPQRRTFQSPQIAPEFVQKSQEETAKAIKRGEELWHDRNLGTNGMACALCHPDAMATHPETYPKYKQQLGRVASVQQVVNWCIQFPMQGKPRDLGSEDLVALEAYMNDRNRGQIMDIGFPGP